MKILAIDPGKDKSGYAVMERTRKVLEKGIVSATDFELFLNIILNKYSIERIVLGDGTSSSIIHNRLLKEYDLPISLVDETNTTFEAEQRYRQESLKGWKKIFSFIIWKPDRPVDDYVAVLLGEKYLNENT